ncbi:MAG: GT2 family glycosyltransferase [Bacteroidia bacterium]|jgi:GT2 family glycosyltransferase
MKQHKVSVVILNYNTKALLEKLIPYVLKTEYPSFEVVVADNASTDGSLAFVQSTFKDVKCIQIDKNRGYAGGYNEALKDLKTDYWVLLNSDVEVQPDWLAPLMDTMLSDENISAVQPKIKSYHNRDVFEYAGACGGFIDKYAYPFCRGRLFDQLEADNGQYDTKSAIFWATGAALLVRAQVYKSLGGLDEDFFAHMEEIDLCWRMQNSGNEIWVNPDSTVYHIGGGTLDAHSPQKVYLNFRNNLVLIAKNMPTAQAIRVLIIRLLLDGLAGVKFIVDGKFKSAAMIVKAHWVFFAKFGFYWSKRKANPTAKPTDTLPGFINLSMLYQYFAKGVKNYSDIKKPPVK